MAQSTVTGRPITAEIASAAPAAPSTTIDGGTFGTGPDTLVLTLAEDAFQGDAQASVTLGATTLTAQPITVTAVRAEGQVETFTFKGDFGGPGSHDLGVSFLNDAYAGTPLTDRNLYVDGTSYDGITSRPAAATFDTAGTKHFTIPPAGDPESFPTTMNGGTFGDGPDTLVLTLSEDAFQGDAAANISIDGKTLNLSPITVTAGRMQGWAETFTFKGTFGTGAHDLGVSFLNDAYAGTPLTDRNLFVNGATYDGITTRPATAALYTAGTTHFTIPPAGDPEATGSVAGASFNTTDAMHAILPTPTHS